MKEVEELRYDLRNASTDTYREYMLKLISLIRTKEVEWILEKKVAEARRARPKVERRNVDRGDVFDIRAYILAPDIEVQSRSGIHIPLRIVCNSAIAVRGSDLEIYLRLGSLACPPLGCWNCRTFLGYTRIPIEDARGRLKVKAKTILYPLLSMECVEDPRVDPDDPSILIHIRGHYRYWPLMDMRVYVLTFYSEVRSDGDVEWMEPIVFRTRDGDTFLFRDYRDTFPLNQKYMVTRPWIEHLGTGAMFVAPRDRNVVVFEELTTYPEFVPKEDEIKTGGNCSVKISSNEYLVLWHSVDRYFGCYYTYAAIFSSDGELLGVSPEPVISPRPADYTGTRPSTVFVNGAVLYKGKLIVSAGKDDELLLILEADLDKVVEKIRFVKG